MVKYFVKGYVYVMYVVNMKKYFSKSPRETKKIAQNLAQKITKERTRKAVILSLEGELGSGKTTFLQGFARGLRVYEKIKSPSFVIMRKYSIRQSKTRKCLEFNFFYHFDAYRIEKPSEILALGFENIIKNPQNIVAIEWGDKIKKILPKKIIKMRFKHRGENKREITIKLI